ncbi:MAG: hypothetical protein K0S74_1724 [Chlamydiales bacterium]|nr:hypothetical protein [Chlamydiales bacterium]
MAGLFYFFENGIDHDISLDSFKRAERIVEWHLHEALLFFGEIYQPDEISNAARLDSWLTSYCRQNDVTEIPVSELQRKGPNALRKKDKMEPILYELVELGRIRLKTDEKKKIVQINPNLLRKDVTEEGS